MLQRKTNTLQKVRFLRLQWTIHDSVKNLLLVCDIDSTHTFVIVSNAIGAMFLHVYVCVCGCCFAQNQHQQQKVRKELYKSAMNKHHCARQVWI